MKRIMMPVENGFGPFISFVRMVWEIHSMVLRLTPDLCTGSFPVELGLAHCAISLDHGPFPFCSHVNVVELSSCGSGSQKSHKDQ